MSVVSGVLTGRGSRSLSAPALVAGKGLYYGALALSFAILILPIVIVVGISLSPTESQAFPPAGFSLQWYSEFFSSSFFDAFFLVSVPIALATAFVASIFGIMAAYVVTRRELPFENEIVMYFISPLIIPPAIIALALMITMNFNFLNFIPQFLKIVAGHIIITLPYTFLTAMTALQSIDLELEQAARNLGATQFQTFRKVTLPLMKSGVVSGFLLAFILSFTDAIVALFLSGKNTTTLPVEIFLFLQFDSSPLIAAVATVQILLVLVLVVLIARLVGFKAVTVST
ncbi:ABC transporter permease [Halobellus salinisoli]|uniref:ABC transporter permease n=1 Tax=Halobellus salinisoli TaxID=3108500 RepID=UPI003008D85D